MIPPAAKSVQKKKNCCQRRWIMKKKHSSNIKTCIRYRTCINCQKNANKKKERDQNKAQQSSDRRTIHGNRRKIVGNSQHTRKKIGKFLFLSNYTYANARPRLYCGVEAGPARPAPVVFGLFLSNMLALPHFHAGITRTYQRNRRNLTCQHQQITHMEAGCKKNRRERKCQPMSRLSQQLKRYK